VRADVNAGSNVGVFLCATALRPFFKNADAKAAFREIGRNGSAVVSGTYNDNVIPLFRGHRTSFLGDAINFIYL
jgi:hypothetical protein